jgi:hypothetical protein
MIDSSKMLVQISNSKICAGVVIENDHVVEAAPCVAYCIGWHRLRVLQYFRVKRGCKVEVVVH